MSLSSDSRCESSYAYSVNDDASFLARAIDLAEENVGTQRGGPFGAVVVRAGVILAEGTNLVTSTLDPTAHAEVVAIRRACAELKDFRLSGCIMYASCEPCPMCLAAIHWSRVERIVFAASRRDAANAGFDDELLYQELTRELGERALRTEQLSLASARRPFQLWDAAGAKVRY